MDEILETPAPRPRRFRAPALVGAGLVAGVVLAGLNVATAQTSPSPTPVPDGKRHVKERLLQHKLGGMHGLKGFAGGALHGEFTTKAPGGGYQTMAMQVGDVTAVSATSVTVKSEDGFSRTYVVDDNTLVNAGNDGIADVKTGNKVRVLALVKDGTARAVHLGDVTEVQRLRDQWRPHRMRQPGTTAPSSAT